MRGSRQASSPDRGRAGAAAPRTRKRSRRGRARRLPPNQGTTRPRDAAQAPGCGTSGLAAKPRLSGGCRSAPSRSPTAVSTSVSGRLAAARLPSRSKASDRRPCKPRPRAIFHCSALRPRLACAIVSVSIPARRHCPTRRRDFNRKDRTGLRKSSILETFAWTDDGWRGVAREHLIIYEMHVGTFTPEGSWEAAVARTAGSCRARDHLP